MQVCYMPPHGSSEFQEKKVKEAFFHPLESLTAVDIRRAAAACRQFASELSVVDLRFNTISLKEPPKRELLAFEAGKGPRPARRVLCILQAPGQLIEAVAQLSFVDRVQDRVVDWKKVEGAQPLSTPDDNTEAEALLKADPYVRRLLEERYGLTDMEMVAFDTWVLNGPPPHLQGRRVMQGFLYFRNFQGDNEYAHPLDMVPVIDLDSKKVVHIDMAETPTPLPMESHNYRAGLFEGEWRKDIKPLNITQPEGPSFQVDGSVVNWQKWQLRVGFDSREGLILHNIGYHDGGRLRPIFHRASLVEMVVPYGEPTNPMTRKAAFDIGEYGLGFSANSLALGCDCLGHIHYFDGVIHDTKGEPHVLRNAICLHEEDAGVLWKHMCVRTGHTEVRRGRRLVVSMIATFMNYEYGFYWYFYQDGNIQFEVKLTGNLSTSVMLEGVPTPAYGIRVAPGVLAANHQHFFCFRLDPAMDDPNGGRDVVVSEVDVVPMPEGPDNYYSNGFVPVERDLVTAHNAMCDVNYEKGRTWKIKNPNVRNPVTGTPVAYKLLPAPTAPLLAGPNSAIRSRAKFAHHTLFVTPHHDDQRYPAGDHIVHGLKCSGLSEWIKEDVSLAGNDPVLWYTFGITHVPRLEDFPIMPVEAVSFLLRPSGFFTYNPTLDVPPSRNLLSYDNARGVTAAAQEALEAAAACCGAGTAVLSTNADSGTDNTKAKGAACGKGKMAGGYTGSSGDKRNEADVAEVAAAPGSGISSRL